LTFRPGATQTKSLSVHLLEAAKVHALPASFTNNALRFVAWKFRRINRHLHFLHSEELSIGEFAIGQHLLLALALNLRIKLSSQVPRTLQRHDSDAPP
jgi:hypothetical protein